MEGGERMSEEAGGAVARRLRYKEEWQLSSLVTLPAPVAPPVQSARSSLTGSAKKSDLAVVAVAKSMAEVKDALEVSTARKASLAGMALQAKLVEMLQDGLEKQERVRDLLYRTQQINQAQASGRTLGEGGGGGVRGTAAAVERSGMDVSEKRGAARGKTSECDESGPARDGPV